MKLEAIDIKAKYGEKLVLKNVNIKICDKEIVTIIGPNGSGKSTLIKVLSRCLKPSEGKVLVEDTDINNISTKDIAKKVAILPQTKHVSHDITVEGLVSYGRYPHLKFRQRLSSIDWEIIDWSMEKTGLQDLRHRYVNRLSGGERQRAWIAMALCQKPEILILDEPTTYLDISYQLEVLELVKELNQSLGLTVVMVLHDLNQAARYSDNIYVLKNGEIFQQGNPKNIIQSNILKDVFRIEADIYQDQINNCPYFIANKII